MYLDEPIPFSRRLAGQIREEFEERGIPGDCFPVPSADGPLRTAEYGVIATSDSAVIDGSSRRVYDLARHILEAAFSPQFIRLDVPGIKKDRGEHPAADNL
jgi:hypothetical protein